jgi:DNA-binding CsgD family transcriptional regulator
VGNVPTHASFSAVGLFPSHQLWNSPVEFFRPSSETFYSQICQKYDLQAVGCVGIPGVAERASARMRTLDGRWFELDASALEDAPGSVAVVILPAVLESICDTVLRGLGLSARERQVALLSLQGQSAKEIARDLQISTWTVQDHLKAVYAKTGVNSRAGLGALTAHVG